MWPSDLNPNPWWGDTIAVAVIVAIFVWIAWLLVTR